MQRLTLNANVDVPTAPTVPAALTGGETPTEAEHNALRTAVADLVTALTDLGVLESA